MTKNLSEKQWAKVPEYLNKWLAYGLRTDSVNKEMARDAVRFLYKDILSMDNPKFVVFLDSPMACQLAFNLIKNTKLDIKIKKPQLDSQLYSQDLGYFPAVAALWGWGSYYGFYDFILHEIFPEKQNEFLKYKKFIKLWPELHYFLPFKDIIFISDFPKKINKNADNRLHSHSGPSLEYSDSWALYYSNGISVNKEFIEADPEKYTKDQILNEKNADIRREMARRLTPQQLIEKLEPKVIDSYNNYELLSIDLGDGRSRPFLKMNNPSMNLIHIEGVKPEIKTVKEAICYRNGLKRFIMPKELT